MTAKCLVYFLKMKIPFSKLGEWPRIYARLAVWALALASGRALKENPGTNSCNSFAVGLKVWKKTDNKQMYTTGIFVLSIFTWFKALAFFLNEWLYSVNPAGRWLERATSTGGLSSPSNIRRLKRELLSLERWDCRLRLFINCKRDAVGGSLGLLSLALPQFSRNYLHLQ